MSGHTPEELTGLEDQLRRLAPGPTGIDRATLLHRAGQRSVRGRWLWPAATLVSTATAGVLATILVLRPPRTVEVERIVHVVVERPTNPPPIRTPTPAEEPPTYVPAAPETLPPHRQLQEHLLRWGLDGLRQPPADEPSRDPTPTLSHLISGESSR